jgi:hypothetical protein
MAPSRSSPYTGWPPLRRSTLDPKSSEDSSAARRRLAAGGSPHRLPAGAAGSLARWQVASLPSRHGCRAPACRPQLHGSTSQRRRGARMSDAHCALLACPHVLRQRPRVQRRPGQRPAAGACPASACPVSARLVSDTTPVPVSDVQSPVSDVGCPVSSASVRNPCVSRSCRALSAPVSSWSATVLWVGTRLGTGRLGISFHRVRDRLVGAQVESGAWSWRVPRWQRRRRLDPATVVEALGRWPGSTAWPTGRRRLRAGSPVCRSAAARRFAHCGRLR